MTIDPTIRGKAAYFGVDPDLIQAVYLAEGGTPDTIIKAVQCSLPSVTTFEKAIEVLCRSAVHAMSDFVESEPDMRGDFIRFWGNRWAPVGANNDPNGLNANWQRNVSKLWSV